MESMDFTTAFLKRTRASKREFVDVWKIIRPFVVTAASGLNFRKNTPFNKKKGRPVSKTSTGFIECRSFRIGRLGANLLEIVRRPVSALDPNAGSFSCQYHKHAV